MAPYLLQDQQNEASLVMNIKWTTKFAKVQINGDLSAERDYRYLYTGSQQGLTISTR